MQETFIRAHRRLDSVKDPSRFGAWLNAIARNVCSERRRSDRRRRVHENGFRGMQGGEARADRPLTDPSGLSQAVDAEALDQLTEAMRSLDERERLALHLHYLEREPDVVAGPMLGLSRSGYYKLLARARDNLAHCLREVHHEQA